MEDANTPAAPTASLSLDEMTAQLKEKLLKNRLMKLKKATTPTSTSAAIPFPLVSSTEASPRLQANEKDIEEFIANLVPKSPLPASDSQAPLNNTLVPNPDNKTEETAPSRVTADKPSPSATRSATLIAPRPAGQEPMRTNTSPATDPVLSATTQPIVKPAGLDVPEQRDPQKGNSVAQSSPQKTATKATIGTGNDTKIHQRSHEVSRDVVEPLSQKTPRGSMIELTRDLEDWLKLTDYFNVQARVKRLDRARRIWELALEKQRIEKEMGKLMEEEDLENGYLHSTRSGVSAALATTMDGDSTLLTPVTPQLPAGQADPVNATAYGTKRRIDSVDGPETSDDKRRQRTEREDEAEQQRYSRSRPGSRSGSVSRSGGYRGRSPNPYHRDTSPYRPAHSASRYSKYDSGHRYNSYHDGPRRSSFPDRRATGSYPEGSSRRGDHFFSR